MKSIRNVDVLYTIHEKSRVLEECICRVESACDTGHFESVDSALRTKPELRAALGTYIRQLLAHQFLVVLIGGDIDVLHINHG